MDGISAATPSDERYGPAPDRLPFERGTDGPRVIVVGIDGSPTSMRAAAYACGLARRQRCQLVVIYVTSPAYWTATVSGVVADAQEKTFHELNADLRDEVRRTAEEHCVPTTFMTRRGDPYTELRGMSDRMKADLVVVGLSTQAGHRFVGSIATRLARLGRWPVVIVP
jgi:nucleotide-binding universal stress UspA family protein